MSAGMSEAAFHPVAELPAHSRRRARGRVKDEAQLFPLVMRKSSEETLTAAAPAEGKKRHGRLVAGILAAFAADPDAALTVADIAMRAYGVELRQVTKKHRVAVLRAMRRVCELEPRFGLKNGEGGEGQMVILDRTRVLSCGLSSLKCSSGMYQWRRCGARQSEDQLRARLSRPGDVFHEMVSPNGAIWRQCQRATAEVGGDGETVARMDAEAEARSAAFLEALEKSAAAGMFGRRRYNPDPVPNDGPDPTWDDNDAWMALWTKAQGKKQRRDVAERRIKAAGGTVYSKVYELPVDLPKGFALDCIRGWAAVSGFDGGLRWVRRATVSSEHTCAPEETQRTAAQAEGLSVTRWQP